MDALLPILQEKLVVLPGTVSRLTSVNGHLAR
jgi:hypothetical protein